MTILLIVLAALGLAGLSYGGLERLGARRALVPGGLRAVAYLAIGLLVANVGCERSPERQRPIALLDASLSMGADPAVWAAAREEAARLGDVRIVGAVDPEDSMPVAGASLVAREIIAAAASGRPVWLVTDGEVGDAAEVPTDLLERTGVRIVPRPPGADLALVRVDVPSRVAVGDTLRITVEISGRGQGIENRGEVIVDVASGGQRWLSGVVRLVRGSGTAELQTVIRDVAPGSHLLEVAVRDAADAEPRTDRRNAVITVTPTPGIVVVASPPSWESRFLFRALEEVAALPVRGFVAVGPGDWRRLGDLQRASAAEVEQSARQADLLALVGDAPAAIRAAAVRGRWEWVGSSSAVPVSPGDWYLRASPISPVAGAFAGLPLDSFPPAIAIANLAPPPGTWVGLIAQAGRRGAERPAIVGSDSAGRRRVTVAATGLWRWAFRGGPSEQAYRSLVAATTNWLLGGADSLTGEARPVRSVTQRGRPVVFERLRPDTIPLDISLEGPSGRRTDTLRFDGSGRAELSLEPGGYRYRLSGGGSGMIAVESYSEEYRGGPPAVAPREPGVTEVGLPAPLRDEPWLFALATLALLGEWWWRRRAGLR